MTGALDRRRDVTIDLDAAAAEIESRRAEWDSAGLHMGPLTWRDASRGWPWQLVARELALLPDSVGFRVTKEPATGAVVLFDGGWADVEWWEGTADVDPEVSAPEVESVKAFAMMLDLLLGKWSRRGSVEQSP